LLKRHEGRVGGVEDRGWRHRVYRCPAGALTVGYGRNIDANPISEAEVRALGIDPRRLEEEGLSEDQAEILLCVDIAKAQNQLFDTYPWFDALDDVRKVVLISMVFNLGFKGFIGFRRTIGAISRGEFRDAAKFMLESNWAKQVRNRALELSEMMARGEWTR